MKVRRAKRVKQAQPNTKTLWLTRDEGSTWAYYYFWLAKPRKFTDGTWDHRRIGSGICPEVFHRRFPKSWRLKPGGGPLECVLTVKT